MSLCRICRQSVPLTWDHVPPRTLTGGDAVIGRHLIDFLNEPQVSRGRISQNGTKFKTICGECNSRIGREYDPELSKLMSYVLAVGGTLPRDFDLSFRLRPERIIRAVVGHLVAGTNQDYLSAFDEVIGDYLFNETVTLPSNLHFYYWIHPFKSTVIVRDAVIAWLTNDIMLSHILKFYPLGFLVTHDDRPPSKLRLCELHTSGMNDEIAIPMPSVVDIPNWPEAPTDSHMILGGESFSRGTYAFPRG